jgi:hypothetical protein
MVKVSKEQPRLVDALTPIISESMGRRTGEVFRKFYEYEDDQEVMAGAKSLLYELMGKHMTDQKLKRLAKKYEA